jgi:putative serine/threonine protein kinase
LDKAPNFLAPDGCILLLFSNLTHRQKVEEFILYNGLDFKPLASSRMFFEELFVYLITKNAAAKKLEPKGFTNIHYFDDGNRGVVYTADYKGKQVAIKLKKEESEAVGRMRNEGKTLALVNKHGLGPKLVDSTDEFAAYEFVNGEYLKNWLPKAPKAKAKKVLIELLRQARVIDTLGLTKEEMHRPLKNAIITKGDKLVLIDWERSHLTKKCHNVTQVCQFLLMWQDTLRKKGIKINDKSLITAAKVYKQNPSDKTFAGVMGLIK